MGSRAGLKDISMIFVFTTTRMSRAEKSRLLELSNQARSNQLQANSTVEVRHD